MKSVILLAGLVALAMTATAQQPPVSGTAGLETPNTFPQGADPLTLSILRSAACPVSMEARFSSATQMVKVGQPDPPNAKRNSITKPSQRIRLSLGKNDNHIVSARVTAYGLNARGRLDHSSDGMAKGTSDIRRTMDVAQFFTNKDGSVLADLVLPGFTAVYSVKLESIRYADGTIRDFAAKSACSVPVNPMMLVADR